MSRYYCAKYEKDIPKGKVNAWCLLKTRCKKLMIRKQVLINEHLKWITVPAIPETMTEGEGCNG